MKFKKLIVFSLCFMFIVLGSCIRARADTIIKLSEGSIIQEGWIVSYYSVAQDTSSMLVIENSGAIIGNGIGELDLDGDAKDYFEVSHDFTYAICLQTCEVTSIANSPVGGLGDWTATQQDDYNPIYNGTYTLLKSVLFGNGVLTSSQIGVLEFFALGISIIWLLFPFIVVIFIIRKVLNW